MPESGDDGMTQQGGMYDDYGMMYPRPRADVNNSYEIQLKTEEFLNHLKDGWLARFKDADGNYVQMNGVKPRMNESGAENLIAFLRGKLHQFNSLSFLQDQDINFIMQEISIAITVELIHNHAVYGINKTDIRILENELEMAVFSNYKRAYRGFTSNQINKSISRIERQDDNQNQKRTLF